MTEIKNILSKGLFLFLIAFFSISSFAQQLPNLNDYNNYRDYFLTFKDCSGWGNDQFGQPKRVYLESQSWWQPTVFDPANPTNVPDDFQNNPTENIGHVHVGTCFPLNEDIDGDTNFRVLVTLHEYPDDADMVYINPHIFGDGFNLAATVSLDQPNSTPGAVLSSYQTNGANIILTKQNGNKNLKLSCEAADSPFGNDELGDTCFLGYDIDLDTKISPYDGLQEFRFFTSILEPDGQEMHVTSGWHANLTNNDDPVNHYAPEAKGDFIEGRGWYTGANYLTGLIFNFKPYETVDETWAPEIETRKGPTLGAQINHSGVYLNPNFHMPGNPNNSPVFEVPGPINTSHETAIAVAVQQKLANLPDGEHRIVIKTDSDCKLNNASKLDDCDCSFNSNFTQNTSRGYKAIYVDDGRGKEKRQMDGNLNSACLYKDPVLYDFTVNPPLASTSAPFDPGVTLSTGQTSGINNDSQKLSSILIVPFNLANSNSGATPEISALSSTGTEGVNSGDVDISFTASPAIPTGSTVKFTYKTKQLVPAQAMASSDFNWTSAQVTMVAGESTKTITLNGLIVDDANIESSEDFVINISSIDQGTATAGPDGTVTIIDDDGNTGPPSISALPSNVTEGVNSGDVDIIFTASPAIPTGSTVKFTYKTKQLVPAQAMASSDFNWTSAQVTMVAGESTKTITLNGLIVDDTNIESSEDFVINISSIDQGTATVGPDGTVTINDND